MQLSGRCANCGECLSGRLSPSAESASLERLHVSDRTADFEGSASLERVHPSDRCADYGDCVLERFHLPEDNASLECFTSVQN